MEDLPFSVGDVVAGKYEVERVLGEGGMGVVIAARHLELDQRVAVKFLLPQIAKRADAAERFRREARAAVKIRSEHVARVLDVGTTEAGVPFMVMEYLEGADLGWELRQHGALAISDAVTHVLEACEAVAEAHAAGIVHRDLKPANLFLARRADGTRLVKVLDFGISKSVTGGSLSDMSLTNTSALIGSPLYMSPEQMHSAKSVDARTDIWALGAILYQTIAGRPPYIGDSVPQLCSSLLNDTPPPLSSFRTDVPEGLQAVLDRALEKDREKRFQNVAQFASELVAFAPGSRVHAERAARVLGITDVQSRIPSSSAVSAASNPDASASRTALGQLKTVASEPPGKAGDRTLASWGKTGDAGHAEAAPSKGRRNLWAVAGVVALVGAGVLWMATHTPARADSEPAARPSVEPAAARVEERAPPAAPVTAAPVAEAAPDAAPPAETASTGKTSARGATTKRPPASSPGPKSTVPDFGGRR